MTPPIPLDDLRAQLATDAPGVSVDWTGTEYECWVEPVTECGGVMVVAREPKRFPFRPAEGEDVVAGVRFVAMVAWAEQWQGAS